MSPTRLSSELQSFADTSFATIVKIAGEPTEEDYRRLLMLRLRLIQPFISNFVLQKLGELELDNSHLKDARTVQTEKLGVPIKGRADILKLLGIFYRTHLEAPEEDVPGKAIWWGLLRNQTWVVVEATFEHRLTDRPALERHVGRIRHEWPLEVSVRQVPVEELPIAARTNFYNLFGVLGLRIEAWAEHRRALAAEATAVFDTTVIEHRLLRAMHHYRAGR